jgi:hypothetical protein
MAAFRRSPNGPIIATLVVLRRVDREVYLYFKGDDAGRDEITVTSNTPAIVDVTALKMNDAPQGIRQVRVVPRKIGQTEIVASSAVESGGSIQKLLSLSIRVVEPVALPDPATDVGALARLFLAEARGPLRPGYDEERTALSVRLMHLVIRNRITTHPQRFLASSASVRAVIEARHQFDGFERYPSIAADPQKVIDNTLFAANDNNRPNQDAVIRHIQLAIDTASRSTPIPDPTRPSHAIVYWRTQGAPSPNPKAIVYETIAGNTFYKQKLPIE